MFILKNIYNILVKFLQLILNNIEQKILDDI